MPSKYVTFTVFNYTQHQAWAFMQMGKRNELFSKVRGLLFFKLMGCGKGKVFSLLPDFSRYTLLAAWDSKQSADSYFNSHATHQFFLFHSYSHQQYNLLPVTSHGKWDGESPFAQATKKSFLADENIAVITRASIHPGALLSFWKHAANSVKTLDTAPGLLYSIGAGEWPLVRQLTFSIWEHIDAMKKFAYGNSNHTDIIKQKQKQKWYSEELFARFKLLPLDSL